MRSYSLRKLKLLTIAVTVFISWGDISYGQASYNNREQVKSLYVLNDDAENVLFSFIRDNQAFATLVAIDAERIENLDLGLEVVEGEKAVVVSQLPFRKMYTQLIYKLKELSVFEEGLAKLEMDEGIQNITQYSILKDLKSEEWQLDVVLKELYKHHHFINEYPNTFDVLILWTVFAHHTKELSLLKEDLLERGELLESMFDESIERYHSYVKKHQINLEKIEEVVNNRFNIEVTVKRCTQAEGKDICGLERQCREIRSLSEIVNYVEKMQEE